MLSALHKGRELLELCTADCCLQIGCLEIISKLRIYILMILTERKLSVLSVKAVTAHIVTTGRTDAVTPPVTHGADDLV